MVSCAGWRDYVLTIGNGPCGTDGRTKLLYSIENVKRDEICQNADLVALPEGVTVKSVFFSDDGVSVPDFKDLSCYAARLILDRTHVSMTAPAHFLHSYTGANPPAPPGFPFSTPSSCLASHLAAVKNHTFPSP